MVRRGLEGLAGGARESGVQLSDEQMNYQMALDLGWGG